MSEPNNAVDSSKHCCKYETYIVTPRHPSENKEHSSPVTIYADGCFDVIHSGHYNALRQSRTLGDRLIVGVHTDEEITRAKRKPVFTNQERLSMVLSCKWTDEVVFGVPYSVTPSLLDEVGADYVAHGDDLPTDSDGRPAYGQVTSRLKLFKRTPRVSTTILISKLCDIVDEQQQSSDQHKKTTQLERSSDDDGSLPPSSAPACSGFKRAFQQFLATGQRLKSFANNRVPNSQDRVIYVDGSWDLFHPGHLAVLKAAKEMGDFLFVGIYDDDLVREKKNRHWPVMSIQERTLNVLSSRFVDDVVIGCPWILDDDTIKILNIQAVCVAEHTTVAYDDGESMQRYRSAKDKGILHYLDSNKLESTLSTMDVVKRIVDRHHEIKQQNEDRIRREIDYTENRTYVQEKH